MKIILTGGGTLGSVSPLIGIWQELKKCDNNLETLFIGTKKGPEKKFVSNYQISFKAMISGKFRRYFSLMNIIDIIKLVIAFFQAIFIFKKFKPDFIISAGSYISVPLNLSAKFYNAKVVLYQSDLHLGLTNKICQKAANLIFTTFSETTKYFKNSTKCHVVGTVLRNEIQKTNLVDSSSQLKKSVLILGGGTGAKSINDLILESLNNLINKYQIYHVTGKGKLLKKENISNYFVTEFLTDDYYQKIAKVDLIISRAGLSTLMELSYLAKPTILIPLPNTPQEQNAQFLCQKRAALCLNQKELTSKKLIAVIDQIINNKQQLIELSNNINLSFNHGGAEKIAQKIYEFK